MHGLKKIFSPLRLPKLSTRGANRDIWQKHIEAWRRSGLRQTEYCRRQNISYNAFRNWKGRLSNLSGTSIKLVEVKNIPNDNNFPDNQTSFHSGSYPGYPPGSGPHGAKNKSGIGFWCGEFYIEVAENFSSGCLNQLLHVLDNSNLRNSGVKSSGFGGKDVDANTGR